MKLTCNVLHYPYLILMSMLHYFYEMRWSGFQLFYFCPKKIFFLKWYYNSLLKPFVCRAIFVTQRVFLEHFYLFNILCIHLLKCIHLLHLSNICIWISYYSIRFLKSHLYLNLSTLSCILFSCLISFIFYNIFIEI